jgi:hypothetical protein
MYTLQQACLKRQDKSAEPYLPTTSRAGDLPPGQSIPGLPDFYSQYCFAVVNMTTDIMPEEKTGAVLLCQVVINSDMPVDIVIHDYLNADFSYENLTQWTLDKCSQFRHFDHVYLTSIDLLANFIPHFHACSEALSRRLLTSWRRPILNYPSLLINMPKDIRPESFAVAPYNEGRIAFDTSFNETSEANFIRTVLAGYETGRPSITLATIAVAHLIAKHQQRQAVNYYDK